MKTIPLILALGLSAASAALAADHPAWGKFADNRIYAQSLVNAVIADHPNIATLSLHEVAPGSADQTMIAANLDRIGKKDDGDDLDVVKGRKTLLAPKPTDPTRFEAMLPLKDHSGRILGLIVIVYRDFAPGSDETPYYLETVNIQQSLAAHLDSAADLFKPAG